MHCSKVLYTSVPPETQSKLSHTHIDAVVLDEAKTAEDLDLYSLCDRVEQVLLCIVSIIDKVRVVTRRIA